jgi:hypothetical protein
LVPLALPPACEFSVTPHPLGQSKAKAAKWKESNLVLALAGVSFVLIADAASFSRSR